MTEFNEQGSAMWFDERCGKFTSSMIYKLMTGGTRSMTPEELANREKGNKRTTIDVEFGETALTYIKEKIGEIKSGQVPIIETFATAWGKEQEPFAAAQYARSFKVELQECGFIQHPEIDYYGGSPDRRFSIDGLNAGIEIKCPVSYAIHYSHCDIESVEQLKKEFPDIYWQCQSNINLTNSVFWDFVSFQPKLKSLFSFRVPRNDEDCKLIMQKLPKARKLLLSMAKKYGVVIPEKSLTLS